MEAFHLLVLQSVALIVGLVSHLLYLITAGRELIIGWQWKVVMKCEICDAGHREPEQKLCQPCMEAVARIWRIVNAPGRSIVTAGESADERIKARLAAIAGRRPSVALR
jgi:hypothetical protein